VRACVRACVVVVRGAGHQAASAMGDENRSLATAVGDDEVEHPSSRREGASGNLPPSRLLPWRPLWLFHWPSRWLWLCPALACTQIDRDRDCSCALHTTNSQRAPSSRRLQLHASSISIHPSAVRNHSPANTHAHAHAHSRPHCTTPARTAPTILRDGDCARTPRPLTLPSASP
jgi:hypothetical protein